jgi:MFS family permease
MTLSLIVLVTLTGGLLIGLTPVVVDGVKKSIEARFKLPAGGADWFVRLFYLAWLPGMPIAGWMLDTLPNKYILFFGLIALILGVTWLALARSLASVMLNAVFLGLAYSCITTDVVRMMTLAFFPEYVETDRLNIASLNLGFMMVGLGAMLGPWVVQAIERWLGFRQGLLTLSVILLAPAALTALCDGELFPKPLGDAASWTELYAHPHMLLIAGVILLYFVLENFLEYWPEAFLREHEYQGRQLQACLIVFWLAFIATRGAAAWWLFHHPDHGLPLTLILVIVSGCVLGNLAGGFDVGSSTLWLWLAGACYGPLLPGLLGIALDFYYPKPLPVCALGALLALSGLDTLVVRPIMNVFTKDRPARSVMLAPAVLAFVLAAPLLLLAFLRS